MWPQKLKSAWENQQGNHGTHQNQTKKNMLKMHCRIYGYVLAVGVGWLRSGAC